MKITKAKSFILRIPLEVEMLDSMQNVTKLEFVGLTVETDAGITGTGYTITVGFGGSVIQNVLDTLFIDEIIGKDPFNVKEIWQDLYYGKSHWIGRAGATTMAQSAIDIAMWDIISKASSRPLWQVLGGCKPNDFPIYNTHAGWLNFTPKELENEALKLIGEGYKALKMKVGLPDARDDYRRVKHMRDVIGDSIMLMVDANQKWDLNHATRASKLLEDLDLTWLEEPMHPDDINAHRLLKSRTSLPIALGEHVYTTYAFRDYIASDAVDFIQVDVCRLGGITPWLEVAALANVNNIRVLPHCGDLMQVHQHLVRTIPNSWYLEVIPVFKVGPFKNQIVLKNGMNITPMEPGASSEFTAEAFAKFRIS